MYGIVEGEQGMIMHGWYGVVACENCMNQSLSKYRLMNKFNGSMNSWSIRQGYLRDSVFLIKQRCKAKEIRKHVKMQF